MNHVAGPLEVATLHSSTETGFLPLEVCVADPMGFSAAMGVVQDDLHLFDCDAAEDHLRNILNASGDWVRSTVKPCRIIPPTSPLSPEEMDIGEFWKSVPFDIPSRMTPLLRSSMMKSNDVGKRTALAHSVETLGNSAHVGIK